MIEIDFGMSMILDSLKYAGELSVILTDIEKNIHSKEMDMNKVDEYINKIPSHHDIYTKNAIFSAVKQIEKMARGVEKFRNLTITIKRNSGANFGIIYNELTELGLDKKYLDTIMIKSIDDFVKSLIDFTIIGINCLSPNHYAFPNYGDMGMYDGDILRTNSSIFNGPSTMPYFNTVPGRPVKTTPSYFNTIPHIKPKAVNNTENTPAYNPFIGSYEYLNETDLSRYLDPVHKIMDDNDDDDDDEDRWIKSDMFKK